MGFVCLNGSSASWPAWLPRGRPHRVGSQFSGGGGNWGAADDWGKARALRGVPIERYRVRT